MTANGAQPQMYTLSLVTGLPTIEEALRDLQALVAESTLPGHRTVHLLACVDVLTKAALTENNDDEPSDTS